MAGLAHPKEIRPETLAERRATRMPGALRILPRLADLSRNVEEKTSPACALTSSLRWRCRKRIADACSSICTRRIQLRLRLSN